MDITGEHLGVEHSVQHAVVVYIHDQQCQIGHMPVH